MELSNHQLMYCTRKLSPTKVETHEQITFCSLENYAAEAYNKALGKENFSDVNKAYENFIQKLVSVIDKLAPFKSKRLKDHSQEWLDGKVLEDIALEIICLRNLSVVK